MNKRVMAWIFGLIIVIVVFAGVVLQQNKQGNQEKEFNVGVILPLTGNLAILGENEFRLLKTAEAVINESRKDKTRIHLMVEDAAFNPTKAAAVANLFMSKGIPVVMVSTTPLAAPVVPIVEQKGGLTVVHSMTNALLKNTKTALRIYPSIKDEIDTIGHWLRSLPQTASIFALRLDTEWSLRWVEEFRKEYPDLHLFDETYSLQQLNIRNILPKIAEQKPTHILLLGYGQEYPTLLKQIREYELQLPIIGNIGFAYAGTRKSAEAANSIDLLTGCVFPFLNIDYRNSDFVRLQESYSQTYGQDVLSEPGALYFYDTLALIAHAIDEVGTDPGAIRTHILSKQNPYDGITGKICFMSNGDTSVELNMARYGTDGKIEFFNHK